MFTIKVHRSAAARDVYSAKNYRTEERDGATVLVLDGAREVSLFAGQKVYVMNELGNTVDTITIGNGPPAVLRTV